MTSRLVPVFYYLPVLLWFGVISAGSSIPGDALPPMPSLDWLFWAHRISHLVEYSVLGLLVSRAGLVNRQQKSLIDFLLHSFLVFCLGLLDEWHQSFVPGRMAQGLDVIFDTICGAIGCLAFQLWLFRPAGKS